MRRGCLIRWGMCGSGFMTCMVHTLEWEREIRYVPAAVRSGCFEAVVGTTTRGLCVQRFATAARRRIATSALAFVLFGRVFERGRGHRVCANSSRRTRRRICSKGSFWRWMCSWRALLMRVW